MLRKAPGFYQNKGIIELIRRGSRFSRQRLPIELWPPLLRDPYTEADGILQLHTPSSIDVRYKGRFRDSLPKQLAAIEGKLLSPEGNVYTYDNVLVFGRQPIVQIDNKYLLPSWMGVDTAFYTEQQRFLKRHVPISRVVKNKFFGPNPSREYKSGFLLLGERGIGFPQWFYEILPKLYWFEGYLEATSDTPILISNSPLESYQKQSLNLMGYSSETWVEHTNTSLMKRLVIPPHPRREKGTHLYSLSPQINWIRKRILSNLSDFNNQFSNRVYVSRADASRRRVRNEDAVMDMLTEFGFERYEPGKLSLDAQIQLFAEADIVVGPHGLAFTNLIYAENASVIELFPRGGATELYFLLANERGLVYEFMTCDAIDPHENTRPRDKDMLVDIKTLREIIADLIANFS